MKNQCTTPIRKNERKEKSEIKKVTKSLKSTKVESPREPASDKQVTSLYKTASRADPEQNMKTGGDQKGTSFCKTASKTEQCTRPCKISRADLDSDYFKRRNDAPHHHQGYHNQSKNIHTPTTNNQQPHPTDNNHYQLNISNTNSSTTPI